MQLTIVEIKLDHINYNKKDCMDIFHKMSTIKKGRVKWTYNNLPLFHSKNIIIHLESKTKVWVFWDLSSIIQIRVHFGEKQKKEAPWHSNLSG